MRIKADHQKIQIQVIDLGPTLQCDQVVLMIQRQVIDLGPTLRIQNQILGLDPALQFDQVVLMMPKTLSHHITKELKNPIQKILNQVIDLDLVLQYDQVVSMMQKSLTHYIAKRMSHQIQKKEDCPKELDHHQEQEIQMINTFHLLFYQKLIFIEGESWNMTLKMLT
ncbi:unnamed protein product [Meganyctiphanes norvegica]|uniref:Uncharacterized protein n=1 Tax=Meganyctiphanes norvegica TaxID=48144 RepID=A0AAV2RV44_MEGNR